MKKLYLYITLFLVVSFTACTDDDFDKDVAPPQSYPEESQIDFSLFKVSESNDISSPIIITDEILDEGGVLQILKLSEAPNMTEAENLKISFKLEAADNNEFTNAISLPSTTTDSIASVNITELNDVVIELFGGASESRNVYLRAFPIITAGASNSLSPTGIQLPNPLVITPYAATFDLEPLYLTGDLINGVPTWVNTVTGVGKGLQILFADKTVTDAAIYKYIGNFKGGSGFKLPVNAGSWDPAWGFDGTQLAIGADNIPGPAESGYYTLTIDLKKMQHTFEPYDISSASVYSKIGLVGDATAGGWDADTELTQVTDHVWVLASAELTPGDLKFRADGGWTVNWGIPDGSVLPFGISSQDGPNFKIENAGTYFVALNDLTGHYIIIEKSKLP